MHKIISVVGARPNFIKIAPIHKAFQKYNSTIDHLICHTGQHFDDAMSQVFFEELEMPRPDFYLGVGSGSHGDQTARVIMKFEEVVIKEKPDLIIVPGDVNSTLAATLVATKLHIPVAHVEAGLRSFDKTMPEEINRIITDQLSEMLFVTEKSGIENLEHEGIPAEKVFFTGNVMIDSLVSYLPRIKQAATWKKYRLTEKNYIVTTFHRPTNVDDPEQLIRLMDFLERLAEKRMVIFPVHPRTRQNLLTLNDKSKQLAVSSKKHASKFKNRQFNSKLKTQNSRLKNKLLLIDPLGYLDFLSLVMNAELVITDSGGIQEETTYMGVQCLTARNSTERPVTVDIGTNHLMGTDFTIIEKRAIEVLEGDKRLGAIPELWDGHASERIVDIIRDVIL